MESFFSRYKNPLVLAIALIAQFFLLAVQVRRPFPAAAAKVDQQGVRALRYGVATVVTPPESALHRGGLSLRGIWSGYLDLVGVREENLQLKQEVDRLRMEQASLAEDARQGERLQDLLAFREHYIQATVPAQVVGTSGTDRSRVLLLDKGSDDGIAVDMPVITPDGIVGRVREVYPHTAQVLEISDPTSASGVLLEETRTRGILRGNAQGQPQIVNLMPDDRIKPGQLVLTSGGDQIFPRGLPVGVVDHVAPDPENEPMVNVVLKPAANLGRLEEVLVVTETGPTPTDRARKDVRKSELVAAGVHAAQEQGTAATVSAEIAEVQRASEVLAERLPSRRDQPDPYAPDASPDASPATSEAAAKPLHPPSALHPDHYTPGGVPAAESLTPGQRYAPLVEGTPATERRTAKAADGSVNATEGGPIGSNAAFANASAAMEAARKAAAEAKAADAARRYALLHPSTAAPASSSAEESATAAPGSSAAGGAVRYTEHTNADGTVTRVAVPAAAPTVLYARRANADGTIAWVPVPGAIANPAVPIQYISRTNADGTVVRVPVAGTGSGSGTVLYMMRTNADGSVVHVPVSASTGATPAIHYVNRTNADGTVTRIAVPSTPPAITSTSSAIRYVNRTNADGSITRIAVQAPAPAAATSGLSPGMHYINRTNADGTVTRVAVPNAPAGTALRYTTRTNADGTVTRVPVPASNSVSASAASAERYVNRTNADGTVTRVAVPAAAPGSSAAAPPTAAKPRTASPPAVTTRVIADGPLPAAGRVTTPARTPSRTGSGAQGTAVTNPAGNTKHNAGPVLVPDDGSRPPTPATPKPAPANAPPPGQP